MASVEKERPEKTPSQFFSERMRETRERRRWSQQDLALRLGEMGAPTDRATVARTETGARGISLDDALMLAAALEVSPLALILPDDEDDRVALAPSYKIDAELLRRWLVGVAPLPVFIVADDLPDEWIQYEDGRIARDAAQVPVQTQDGKVLSRRENDERVRFWEQSSPLGQWKAYRRPGVRHLVEMADAYAYAAGDDQVAFMKRYLAELAAEIERQRRELDEKES